MNLVRAMPSDLSPIQSNGRVRPEPFPPRHELRRPWRREGSGATIVRVIATMWANDQPPTASGQRYFVAHPEDSAQHPRADATQEVPRPSTSPSAARSARDPELAAWDGVGRRWDGGGLPPEPEVADGGAVVRADECG
jgi:hypothetical protein